MNDNILFDLLQNKITNSNISQNKFKFSFEIFPPKKVSNTSLINKIKQLEVYSPQFVSITCGADGSTQENTQLIKDVRNNTSINIVPHLTCINATEQKITETLNFYHSLGIKQVLALRGDKPDSKDTSDSKGRPENTTINNHQDCKSKYNYATDLIETINNYNIINNNDNYDIFVASYPEKHPESKSLEHDIDILKKKCDLGVKATITQFFFNNQYYYEFWNKIQQQNIDILLIPGIIPIKNFTQVYNYAKKCHTIMPKWIENCFDIADITTNNDNNHSEIIHQNISTTIAVIQSLDLIRNGVKHLHFYILNQINLITSILQILNNIKK